jgi:hypothetical protein
MRRFAAFALILAIALVIEEATQGLLLGWRPLLPLCDAIGGEHATGPYSGRSYTRLCYWLGDCGHWAAPVNWMDRLKPGDPRSKIIFWLGEPDRLEGEDLLWQCGKGGDAVCKAVVRDGRLVTLER